MYFKQAFLAIILSLSNIKVANSESFEFGDPVYFGNGCPEDTVQIVKATNGYAWSVLFSDFIAATDGDDTFDRRSCNMAVTIDIKPNKKIGVYKTQYRGYTYGPSTKDGSYSTFDAEWFFAGQRGETKDREWNSDRDEILIENHTKEDDVEYCECGESTIFRINTAIVASKEKPSHPDVEVGIDTTDQISMKYGSSGGKVTDGSSSSSSDSESIDSIGSSSTTTTTTTTSTSNPNRSDNVIDVGSGYTFFIYEKDC